MAIRIEFVNLIIPIERINNSQLEGGFKSVINKYKNAIGRSVWFDEYLFRIGWMDTWMIDSEIDFWINQGLKPLENRNGTEFWYDMFAISCGINQFNTNCDWIKINSSQTKAWLKGTNRFNVYPKILKLSHGFTHLDLKENNADA